MRYTTEVPNSDDVFTFCISSTKNYVVASSGIVPHNRKTQMIQMQETRTLCKEVNN